MNAALIATLITSAVVAIFASITAPLILAHRTEKMHRQDREADWERQDLVAARAERARVELAASQKAIADQAARAAALLLENNERVARTQKQTNGKLDVIHELVNSNLSSAMQDKLDALITSAAMMQEVIDLKRAAGREPTPEAIDALKATEDKIRESRAAIADRLQQSEVIAARQAAAAAAAAAAADDDDDDDEGKGTG